MSARGEYPQWPQEEPPSNGFGAGTVGINGSGINGSGGYGAGNNGASVNGTGVHDESSTRGGESDDHAVESGTLADLGLFDERGDAGEREDLGGSGLSGESEPAAGADGMVRDFGSISGLRGMRARALGGQQPTTVLSGVVQGGQRPLPEVTVTVTDRTGSQCARATTDASGVFHVSGLEPGSYVLVFARAGYRPQATVVPPGPMPSRLDITLEPTSGIGGTVRERIAGRPIPGATVTAIGAAGEVIASTVSGEDGGYYLAGVDAPQITLVAAAPLADPVATVVALNEGPVTDADLELELRGALTGVVTSGGWPLSGVRLLLRGADGAVVSSTVTDDGGRYRFGAVAPGSYTVTTAPAAPCVQTIGPSATLADLRLRAASAEGAGGDPDPGPATEVFAAVPPQSPRGG
ncbi:MULTISPECIES: MSCRAMM family protein [Prauserella salsuginis group]|uniref:Uncharacterized protein n=2 Tax=Prauserella salsuginis group TaxID=2893672 RepID=A0A839XQI7_9PSEU|nr:MULTISPECIES: carboxypeptidase-like regulatory domain-containing protein [Prauserella salsuginis group]MBB3662206.1 hypothetical protein [Prauserella sediminis]MCR3719897.1 Carboxypeptidase regulatory-like domain-containing protein [Prauserella flava]MCR3736560.1 Carboxypeptidase regulatory-like domain-containing protein [Prauserella salsuginis]